MKNLLYTSLALLLLLTACREEQITLEEPIITQDPPKEVEGAFFSGQLTDTNGEVVSGLVKIYQSGLLQGEVFTDASGFYNTLKVPLEIGPEVTFAIEEEQYEEKYRRNAATKDAQVQNFRLTPITQDNYGLDNNIEEPGSDDLVRVFATITDYEGMPIPNVTIVVADKFEEVTNVTVAIYGKSDLTDENGYMEVLMPKDTPLYFFGYVQDEQVCYPDLNQRDTLFLEGALGFEELGSITTDTELIENDDIRLDKTSYGLTGRFLECDGLPVQNGTVEVEVSYLNVYNTRVVSKFETSTFDSNGDFTINFEYCYRGEVQVEIMARNSEGFGVNQTNMVTTSDLSAGLGILKACDNFNNFRSYLNIDVGTQYSFDSIEFFHGAYELPFAFEEINGFHSELGFVFFVTEELSLGEIGVVLSSRQFGGDFSISSGPMDDGQVIANVTEIMNGEIKGTLSGEVEVTDEGWQPINGDFIISYFE